MPSLDNGSSSPARCSKRECHIDSFTVSVDPETNSLILSMTDACNQMTSIRMFKSVISAAIVEYAADEEITIPADTCWTNCCDGLPNVVYTFGDLTATYALTGVVAGEAVNYVIEPPFHSVV